MIDFPPTRNRKTKPILQVPEIVLVWRISMEIWDERNSQTHTHTYVKAVDITSDISIKGKEASADSLFISLNCRGKSTRTVFDFSFFLTLPGPGDDDDKDDDVLFMFRNEGESEQVSEKICANRVGPRNGSPRTPRVERKKAEKNLSTHLTGE